MLELNETTVQKLRKYYHARAHNNDYKVDNLGFGFIHYALIRNYRPKDVLIVGSQRGFVPAICGLACKHEGRGHVHFVDAGYDLEDKNSWGGIGMWKGATRDYWEPIECEAWITIHCMTTEEFSCQNRGGFGYIYIDGDHSYEGVMRDFELFWPRLEFGGLITFHDILVDKKTQWGKCGVKEFWDKVRGQFASISIDRDAGLGIIQKDATNKS